MNKKAFIIIFLLIIFSVFLIVPIKEVLIHTGKIEFYRNDNWKTVEKTNDPIYDKIMSIEANIENRYNNYFPFYNEINSFYYNSIINIDSMYLNDIYLKDNNDKDHIFYDRDNDFFYLINKYSKEELDKRLEEQVEFYNDINNKYPSINLALYIPLRYESTSYKNINNNNDKINEFLSKLNENINAKVFDSETVEDYLKYYYKTDHHYNSYGAEKAYLDIMEMFNLENNIDFEHEIIKTPYLGSMAKSTLLRKVYDDLSAMKVSNDIKVLNVDENFKPLELEDKTNPFYDYYVKYFNGAYGEVIYENGVDYNRNLLIIGDSMSWQIDYLLAKNFDKTLVINTKYSPWTFKDLLLKDYIDTYKITHILFLREAKNIVFDADNFAVDKKVIR
ncbi:MAG: hypothetical protein IJ568_03145 [Bacilli bacterium]|nr:hypothetical protein [Bacilli bacterium]